jgi:hypothetical protein
MNSVLRFEPQPGRPDREWYRTSIDVDWLPIPIPVQRLEFSDRNIVKLRAVCQSVGLDTEHL